MVYEQTGQSRGFGEVAAAIATQIEHESVDVLGLQLADELEDVAGGAAEILVTGILCRDVLVEARHGDDTNLEGLAIAGDILHFFMRRLRLERHFVTGEFQHLFLGAGCGAGAENLQPDIGARFSADELHDIVEAPAYDIGEATLMSLPDTGDAVVGVE